MGDLFEGLQPGATVYLARDRRVPHPARVGRVDAHYGYLEGYTKEAGVRFRLKDGSVDPCGHAVPCRIMPETPEFKARAEYTALMETFDREVTEFRLREPSREQVLAVIRALNPDAWK